MMYRVLWRVISFRDNTIRDKLMLSCGNGSILIAMGLVHVRISCKTEPGLPLACYLLSHGGISLANIPTILWHLQCWDAAVTLNRCSCSIIAWYYKPNVFFSFWNIQPVYFDMTTNWTVRLDICRGKMFSSWSLMLWVVNFCGACS